MNNGDGYRESLYTLYIEKRLPMDKVAKELNISVGKVYNDLTAFGIKKRTRSEAMKDFRHTEEAKEKISRGNKGKKLSEETKRKISKSHKKGGIGCKKKRSDGYIAVYFPDHPKSTKDGYVMEHVLVMECAIGRWLTDDEVVHHINRKKDDNRLENLKLMTNSEHMRYHMLLRYGRIKECEKYV